MNGIGLDEAEIARIVRGIVDQYEAATSFHWENEEMNDLVELVAELITAVVFSNNRAIANQIAGRHEPF